MIFVLFPPPSYFNPLPVGLRSDSSHPLLCPPLIATPPFSFSHFGNFLTVLYFNFSFSLLTHPAPTWPRRNDPLLLFFFSPRRLPPPHPQSERTLPLTLYPVFLPELFFFLLIHAFPCRSPPNRSSPLSFKYSSPTAKRSLTHLRSPISLFNPPLSWHAASLSTLFTASSLFVFFNLSPLFIRSRLHPFF